MFTPPYPGGRKDLVDRIADLKRPEDGPAALADWNRQQYARDVVQHPRREKIVIRTIVAVLISAGAAMLIFVILYTLYWAPR